MNDKPKKVEVEETVYFEKGKKLELLLKMENAWRDVHKRNRDSNGKKVAISSAPYVEWVKKRVETLMLPFPRENPLYEQPPLVLSKYVPTEEYNQV